MGCGHGGSDGRSWEPVSLSLGGGEPRPRAQSHPALGRRRLRPARGELPPLLATPPSARGQHSAAHGGSARSRWGKLGSSAPQRAHRAWPHVRTHLHGRWAPALGLWPLWAVPRPHLLGLEGGLSSEPRSTAAGHPRSARPLWRLLTMTEVPDGHGDLRGRPRSVPTPAPPQRGTRSRKGLSAAEGFD